MKKISLVAVLSMVPLFAASALFFPLSYTEAATTKPTCSLSFTHNNISDDTRSKASLLIAKNDTVVINWSSKNATKAIDVEKDSIELSGVATVTPARDTTYSYTFSNGSKKVTCSLEVEIISGTITTKSTVKSGEKVTLSGKVEGVKKVVVAVYPVGTTTAVYTTKSLSVKNKKYSFKMPKALADGNYRLQLQTTDRIPTVLASGSLTVGDVKPIATSLVVQKIPLLAGGAVKPGRGVAVAYLQVINVGTSPAVIDSFTMTQNGTAPVTTIVGVSINDEFGLAKGSVGNMVSGTPFTGNSVLVPVPFTLAPKESRLFTVRAVVGANATANIGQTLSLSLQSLNGNARVQSVLPISGVTWTIAQ